MVGRAKSEVAGAPGGWAVERLRDKAKQLGGRLAELLDVCAAAWAAAALYDELSRLSDAELERRRIPRRDLHRFVFETATRRST